MYNDDHTPVNSGGTNCDWLNDVPEYLAPSSPFGRQVKARAVEALRVQRECADYARAARVACAYKGYGYSPSEQPERVASGRLVQLGTPYVEGGPLAMFKRKPLDKRGMAYQGECSVVSGPGGVSKSTLAGLYAISIASGLDLIGSGWVKQRRVVFANFEDQLGEVLLRLRAIARHYGLTESQLSSNLYVIGAEDAAAFKLTEPDARGRDAVRHAGFEMLDYVLGSYRPGLISIDPLVSAVAGGGNDSGVMGQLMGRLKVLATRYDCAVQLIAHTRKYASAATDGADATSGSGAISNLARAAFGVVSVTQARGRQLGIVPGEERHFRELVPTKGNLQPLGEGQVFKIVGVPMANAIPEWPEQDWVAVAVPCAMPAGGGTWISPAVERDVLKAIANGTGGVPLSPRAGKGLRAHDTACARAVAVHLPGKPPEVLASAAKAVVASLIARGWVETVDCSLAKASRGSNRGRGLSVKWGATPWRGDPKPGAFCHD